jgi:hypothetical protein
MGKRGVQDRLIAAAATAAALTVSACSSTVSGSVVAPPAGVSEYRSAMSPPAPTPPPPAEPGGSVSTEQQIVDQITDFWNQEHGLDLRQVQAVPKTELSCAKDPYGRKEAVYCATPGPEDRIEYRQKVFDEQNRLGGELAEAITLAHVVGHGIQHRQGWDMRNEPQADCLSGVYIRAHGWDYNMTEDTFMRALQATEIVNDPDRIGAFKQGFDAGDGLAECGAIR